MLYSNTEELVSGACELKYGVYVHPFFLNLFFFLHCINENSIAFLHPRGPSSVNPLTGQVCHSHTTVHVNTPLSMLPLRAMRVNLSLYSG